MSRFERSACVLALLASCAVVPARADIFGFNCLNPNPVTPNCQAGVLIPFGQLQVDITAAVLGMTPAVQLVFTNAGAVASIVSDIYFDDPTTTAGAVAKLDYKNKANTVVESKGVDFGSFNVPGKGSFPEGTNATPPFAPKGGDASIHNEKSVANGINNTGSESLTLTIALNSGQTFAGLLSAIASRQFNIGLHIQSLADGTSDAYELGGVVPEPTYGVFLVLGLGVMFWISRRRAAARAR
jgi:hypothetical protein